MSPPEDLRGHAVFSHSLFYVLLILLAAVTLGSFVFNGPAGWGAGFLYIAYDTCLLAFVAWETHRLLGETAAASAPSDFRPTLSVLIAARNEAPVLPLCLDALLNQTDPPESIYVVDDGSTDDTIRMLVARYAVAFTENQGLSAREPRLRVWSKMHTGKARSLNEVWPRVDADVIVTIDADTILEPEATAAVRRAFAEDAQLAAACGVLTPRCRGGALARIFEMFQTYEYIRAFLSRLAWMRKDALLLISGAFAAYRKSALESIDGYDPTSLVEDYDLIHRLHRDAHRRGVVAHVRVIAGARAETDAPAHLGTFLKQRQRWFSGFLQTQFKNRDMVGNPAFGKVGTMMLPIKTADMLQPIYGLAAFFLLLRLFASGRGISPWIVWVIGIKLILDLIFHFWSVKLYYVWQGRRATASQWALAALATMTEPISFQLLRHAGALIGWIGFLRGTNDWVPQREENANAH
jgi:cellulose synthase/poly-beta-1,6-N-acetylglucosamine synthase-like glycosyltransferase